MKSILAIAAMTIVCSSALAQAPAGVVNRPAAEANPTASGGAAQSHAGMRSGKNGHMDLNNDGFISRSEWNTYHAGMWTGMKPNAKGMVAWSDVQSHMGGTPK